MVEVLVTNYSAGYISTLSTGLLAIDWFSLNSIKVALAALFGFANKDSALNDKPASEVNVWLMQLLLDRVDDSKGPPRPIRT